MIIKVKNYGVLPFNIEKCVNKYIIYEANNLIDNWIVNVDGGQHPGAGVDRPEEVAQRPIVDPQVIVGSRWSWTRRVRSRRVIVGSLGVVRVIGTRWTGGRQRTRWARGHRARWSRCWSRWSVILFALIIVDIVIVAQSLRWHHIERELAAHIARRPKVGHQQCLVMIAGFVFDAHAAGLARATPHELREAAGLGGEARAVVVIVARLVVPGLNRLVGGSISARIVIPEEALAERILALGDVASTFNVAQNVVSPIHRVARKVAAQHQARRSFVAGTLAIDQRKAMHLRVDVIVDTKLTITCRAMSSI